MLHLIYADLPICTLTGACTFVYPRVGAHFWLEFFVRNADSQPRPSRLQAFYSPCYVYSLAISGPCNNDQDTSTLELAQSSADFAHERLCEICHLIITRQS